AGAARASRFPARRLPGGVRLSRPDGVPTHGDHRATGPRVNGRVAPRTGEPLRRIAACLAGVRIEAIGDVPPLASRCPRALVPDGGRLGQREGRARSDAAPRMDVAVGRRGAPTLET